MRWISFIQFRPLPKAFVGIALLALLLGGCPPNIVITSPMKTLTLADGPLPPEPGHASEPGTSSDAVTEERPCALVLLPGGFDRPSRYAREDFAGILRERHPEIEVVAADAHLRYYLKGIALDRLRDEVIGPLHERGYRVWLAGISLGGMGTLLYGSQYGKSETAPIAGYVAMAPFLGQDALIDEIRRSGGPLEWQPTDPPTGKRGRDTVGYDIWPWLADWHRRGDSGETVPSIALAYGLKDDFAPAGELLSPLLAEDRVFTHPGGHDWSAWTPLWRDLVSAGVFDSCDSRGT